MCSSLSIEKQNSESKPLLLLSLDSCLDHNIIIIELHTCNIHPAKTYKNTYLNKESIQQITRASC